MPLTETSREALEYLRDMALMAAASYGDGQAPGGWQFLDLSETGLPRSLYDGITYSNSLTYGEARVLVNAGGEIIISLRGTDQFGDIVDDLGLALGLDYWTRFEPLLNAVASYAQGAKITIVGHSLGGAAVHQIAAQVSQGNLAFLDEAAFASFSSPLQFANSAVLSYGYANDWIYGKLDPLKESAADFDQIYLYTAKTAATEPFPGLPALTNHRVLNLHHGLERLLASGLWADRIDLSAPIVIGTGGELIAPSNLPGREDLGTLVLLGLDKPFGAFAEVADRITGRDTTALDVIDGMGGNDSVRGLGGADWVLGGAGLDLLSGGMGDDILFGGSQNDTVKGEDGLDRLFGGGGKDSVEGGRGSDLLLGGGGDDILISGGNEGVLRSSMDFLFGGSGKDTLMGSAQKDVYLITANDRDTIIDPGGNNIVYFSSHALLHDAIDAWMEGRLDGSYFTLWNRPFTLDSASDWQVPYAGGAAAPFLLDAALARLGQTFASIDAARPSEVVVDLAGFTRGILAEELFLGPAGTTLQIASLGEGSGRFSVFCGDGVDEISLSRKAIRDALAGRDWDFGELIIQGFDPAADSFSFAAPFAQREIEDWYLLRPGLYHDVDMAGDLREYHFFEVVQEPGGGTYLNHYFDVAFGLYE